MMFLDAVLYGLLAWYLDKVRLKPLLRCFWFSVLSPQLDRTPPPVEVFDRTSHGGFPSLAPHFGSLVGGLSTRFAWEEEPTMMPYALLVRTDWLVGHLMESRNENLLVPLLCPPRRRQTSYVQGQGKQCFWHRASVSPSRASKD